MIRNNSHKIVCAAGIILLLTIITNLFWIYPIYDEGTKIYFQKIELNLRLDGRTFLSHLIIDITSVEDKNQIVDILDKNYPDIPISEEDSMIIAFPFGLIFDNNKLVKVVWQAGDNWP